MSRITRYFMQDELSPDDINVLDLTPSLSSTVPGQTLILKGTNSVDMVLIDGADELDFSESLSGIDLLFIKGWRREMIASVSGNNLRLARSDGLVLTAGDGDRVVFLDGAIDTHAWLQALAHQAPDPTPDPSLTSDGDPDTLIERVNEQAQSKASIMGYAGGNEASIFGQVQAGMQLVLKGSNLDDVVYVKPGTKVDFSESLSGVDQIVLSGSWAAYTKTMQGSGLRLQRDSEQVDVSPGDLVIFADGNAPVSAILAHLPGNPSREALGDAWQPSPTSPPLDPPPDLTPPRVWILSDVSALGSGQTATLRFYVSEDPGQSFGWDDVTVTGGTLGPLSERQGTGTAQDPYFFSATFTPSDQALTTAQIRVAGQRMTDLAGHANEGDSQLADGLRIDTLSMRIEPTTAPVAVERGVPNDLPDWTFTAAPSLLNAPYSLDLQISH
ncbi:MAG: hypothetical protein RIQ38_2193, partial [Pseudomonadota bacterium]